MRTRLAIACASACCIALSMRCNGDDGPGPCDACDDITPAPLAVAVTPQEIWLHPNDVKPVAVALARGPGGDGEVAISIETDAGVTTDALTIADGQTTGTLTIHASPTFTQGTTTVIVDAASAKTLAKTSLVIHVSGASGTPDTSFGAGGLADFTSASGADRASAMIVLQSGVLVGGTHVETNDAASVSTIEVLRLTSGGGIDNTFTATSATPDVMSELNALAMMSNGTIYAVGDVRGSKASFAAVRVLATGGLDPAYAVSTSVTFKDDIAYASGIEPGGNLVAAGSLGDHAAVGVARYTQSPLPPSDAGVDTDADADDGAAEADASPITSHLDPSFANGGVLLASLAKVNAGASSLLVAPDGSLYVLGYQQDTSTDLAFLHVTAGGVVDTSTAIPLTTGMTGAASALLQPDGTIVVASDDNGQALVLRLLANGSLDTSFASAGRSALTFGAASAASAITRDPSSGKIVIGGTEGAQCLIARLTPAGAIDGTFANAGSLAITHGDSCSVVAIGIDDNGLVVVLENFVSSSVNHMVVERYWP